MAHFKLDCILFDLDGTLVDSAPDLFASLNHALLAYQLPAIADHQLKPLISQGALAMINMATVDIDNNQKQLILETMLDYYQKHLNDHSRLYPGILETLLAIENLGLKWGVVTNKRQRFTIPLMQALNLQQRAACIISGDSTEFCKPHPAPLLAACQQAQVSPENCLYIGDAAHDISAGVAANMKTLVALYGYLQSTDKPENWGADGLISSPSQLLEWI